MWGGTSTESDATHKKNRWSYAKASFNDLKKYFEETNWSEIKKAKNNSCKAKTFVGKYVEGVQVRQHVPLLIVKEREENGSVQHGEELRRKRMKQGRDWRDDHYRETKEYKLARNGYGRIRREEEK